MYQLCAALSLAARQCPTVSDSQVRQYSPTVFYKCPTVQSDSIARQRPTIGCRQAFIPYLVANHTVNFPYQLPNSSNSSAGQKASAGSIISPQIASGESVDKCL
jgi:hypothetical protein